MRRIFRVCIAIFALIFFSGCDDKKIDENIISTGSEMSAKAMDKAKNLDKESYKELADLFLDTSEIDFSREVLIIFGKNQCKYCDMMKDDIKKNPALKAKIKDNFNPYYVNTSYDKIHKLRGFLGESKANANIEIPTARFAPIFGVNATPQIVFLDKNMKVKYIFAGYTLKLEKMIDNIVANPAPMGNYAHIDKALNALKKDIK